MSAPLILVPPRNSVPAFLGCSNMPAMAYHVEAGRRLSVRASAVGQNGFIVFDRADRVYAPGRARSTHRAKLRFIPSVHPEPKPGSA